jgi:hypothetical protein
LLDPAQLPRLRRLDATLTPGEPYPSYASAVDEDGNELAGIRLPDLTVPVATHTGWVARHPDSGGAGQLVDMMGASVPFAPTAAERQARADPRPSIAERYRDRADYTSKVRAAAEDLVTSGFILPEDIDLVVEIAAQRFDVVAPRAVSSAR